MAGCRRGIHHRDVHFRHRLLRTSVFLNVLHQQRGWPVSVISIAVTVHFLVSAVLVIRLPAAHQRFGLALVTQAGVAALVIGMIGWSLAVAPWQLFVAAMLSGAGWAATSGAAIIAMVSPWFDRRRALALSHALNGASFGGILFAPLWVMLIGAIGFTQAVVVIGCATIAILWPLASRYLRPTPETAWGWHRMAAPCSRARIPLCVRKKHPRGLPFCSRTVASSRFRLPSCSPCFPRSASSHISSRTWRRRLDR